MDNNEIQRFWLRDMEFVLYADHIKITEEKDAEIENLKSQIEYLKKITATAPFGEHHGN